MLHLAKDESRITAPPLRIGWTSEEASGGRFGHQSAPSRRRVHWVTQPMIAAGVAGVATRIGGVVSLGRGALHLDNYLTKFANQAHSSIKRAGHGLVSNPWIIGICKGNSVDAKCMQSDKLGTNCDPPESFAFQAWTKMRVAQETWV